MKQELALELEAQTLRCPVCREPCEPVYYKRSGYWAVIHGRGNGIFTGTTGETCKLRWEELSRGDNEQSAISAFKEQNQ